LLVDGRYILNTNSEQVFEIRPNEAALRGLARELG
jgi:hypothetical protein